MAKRIEHPSADTPAKWEPADAAAFQALAKGTATEAQQQRALNWLIYQAAGTYDSDYRPDPREHAFVSGRRNVGLQVVKLISLNLTTLATANNKEQ